VIAPRLLLEALATVHDPELDEPITSLGFVTWCEVSADGDVEVGLRLPTPQCAPNFAFLMAADARAAANRLPGVRSVNVVLEDHYTGAEIGEALRAGGGFTNAFPGESDDDQLDALRTVFRRKALVARQARLCEQLLAEGVDPDGICSLQAADLPPGRDARRCLELRSLLGLPHGPESPAFVLPAGGAFTTAELARWLRMARLVRTSLEVNGEICRSLLKIRHGAATNAAQEVRV
jgi:metal-sulfur cluster biosynthetic enzyme